MDAATLSDRFGAPVWLIERSAGARAKASGSTIEEIYAAWAGASPSTPTSEPAAEPTESAPETEAAPQAAAAAGLSGAALLAAVAEARGMPESLTERSAQARASAVGVSLDDVLHEWAEEEGLAASTPAAPASEAAAPAKPEPEPAPSEPVDVGISGPELLTAVAEARGLPESLVERSAQARAETAGYTLESVLYEWAEEEGIIEVAPPAVPVEKEAPATSVPAAQKAAPAAKVAAGLTGAALLTAVAEARGMPESLVERSAGARAKKTGVGVDDVLNEWAAEEGLVAEEAPPATPAVAPVAAALSGAALLTALAEKRGMPESLVERSAKAKAKKTDTTVDAVLNEWAAEEGIGAASPESPVASPAPAAALSGAALLTALAEKRGMPESLVERSAKAKAKKTDTTVEAVLNEWALEEGLVPSETPAEAAPAAAPAAAALSGAALLTALAEKRGMPESLIERSAKAKAKKTDTTVDAVLNEWANEEGLVADAAPAEASPAAAPAAAGALTGAALLTAVAEARGMPESLVERSAKAKAKKTDTTVDAVLAEWAREEGIITEAAPAAAPVETAVAEEEKAVEVPEAEVTAEGRAAAAEVAPEPKKKLHPLAVGAIAAVGLALVLSVLMALVDVPASGTDAPWYAAGLEPFVAAVVVPAVLLVAVVALGFVAWSPSIKPSIRRFALMILAFLALAVVAGLTAGALLA